MVIITPRGVGHNRRTAVCIKMKDACRVHSSEYTNDRNQKEKSREARRPTGIVLIHSIIHTELKLCNQVAEKCY